MMGEGGEGKMGTNVNFLLEEFGIALNSGGRSLPPVPISPLHILIYPSIHQTLSPPLSLLSPSLPPDSVTRKVYYKFFHPKEVLITNGVLNREITRAAGKSSPAHSPDTAASTQRCAIYRYLHYVI